jgi:hypothetical protein
MKIARFISISLLSILNIYAKCSRTCQPGTCPTNPDAGPSIDASPIITDAQLCTYCPLVDANHCFSTNNCVFECDNGTDCVWRHEIICK